MSNAVRPSPRGERKLKRNTLLLDDATKLTGQCLSHQTSERGPCGFSAEPLHLSSSEQSSSRGRKVSKLVSLPGTFVQLWLGPRNRVAHCRARSMSSTHLPSANKSARLANSSLPSEPVPLGRCNNINGMKPNSFHALDSACSSPATLARCLSSKAAPKLCRKMRATSEHRHAHQKEIAQIQIVHLLPRPVRETAGKNFPLPLSAWETHELLEERPIDD